VTKSLLRIVLPALVQTDLPTIGGLGTFVQGLAPRLRARGHKVLVIGHGPPDAAHDGFRPLFNRRPARGRDLSWALWKERNRWDFPADTVIHMERPDHGMAFRAGPWPLVVSFHGLHGREIARARGKIADRIYRQITHTVLSRAEASTWETDFDRQEVIGNRQDLLAKSLVIPNSIDRTRLVIADQKAARRQLGLPEDVFAVGFVGRHDPEKNIPTLMDAVSALPGAELWLAGKGRLTPMLKRRAGPGVRFVGYQPNLQHFYSACDVMSLASIFEGFPTVILESWLCGKPIVVPKITGLLQLFANGGGVVADAPSVPAMTAALDEVRQRLAAHDPEFDPQKLSNLTAPYDWEVIIDSFLAVYERARSMAAARRQP